MAGWEAFLVTLENMPMQYTEIFKVVKNENFQKIFFIFHLILLLKT